MTTIQSEITELLQEIPTDLYTGRHNLVLTFRTSSSSTGQVDSVGNPVLGHSTTEVQVIARESDRSSQEIEGPGVDVSATYLVCRCVSPKALPTEVISSLSDRVPAVFIDPHTQAEKRGEFFFTPSMGPVFGEAGPIMGQYFEGFFQGVGV